MLLGGVLRRGRLARRHLFLLCSSRPPQHEHYVSTVWQPTMHSMCTIEAGCSPRRHRRGSADRRPRRGSTRLYPKFAGLTRAADLHTRGVVGDSNTVKRSSTGTHVTVTHRRRRRLSSPRELGPRSTDPLWFGPQTVRTIPKTAGVIAHTGFRTSPAWVAEPSFSPRIMIRFNHFHSARTGGANAVPRLRLGTRNLPSSRARCRDKGFRTKVIRS